MSEQERGEPLYPILSPEELGTELPDARSELPPEMQITLDERDDLVVKVVTPDMASPEERPPPSTLREIKRLCGAETLRCVGLHGPAVAGLASEENSEVEALRKFEVPHGRDALEIALKLSDRYPELLKTTVTELAKTQGVEHEEYQEGEPFRQEQPGSIILLDREPEDPVGQKFSRYLNWGFPFYGSVDAPPTFVSAIARHAETNGEFLEQEYTGKNGETYKIEDALERSVGWVLARLEDNDESLLEFRNRDPVGGMDSQAWKDSAYAYVHEDGSRANHKNGIASVEVQALAYDALYDAANIYADNDREKALTLRERAEELRETVLDTFWVENDEKGGYFALATDRDEHGNLRTLNVRASNMGRLLNSHILEGDELKEKREAVARHMFSEAMLAPAGVRTLASDEAGFQEGGYHTGSVWLWDSAYIADGLEKQGMPYLAWELRERMWRTIEGTRAFPEFVNGGTSLATEVNTSEVYVWNKKDEVLHLARQPPQEYQGWTVSALLAAKYEYPNWLRKKAEVAPTDFEQEILHQLSLDG